MALAVSAQARWKQLDGTRNSFIRRCEEYAAYTLPKICTVIGYNQNNDELSHDYQALGAQLVNHLANKIMLAGFAPSRPFFRLDPTPEMQQQLTELDAPFAEITEALSSAEQAAIKKLDSLAMRPKLYEVIKHLIVTGNVLLDLSDDTARVRGIKKFCVRRSMSGKVLEILIADPLVFDELDEGVQDEISLHRAYQPDAKVTLYTWVKVRGKKYTSELWVDSHGLPDEFNGSGPEDKIPYRALTWDLSDDANYGTGLVEDYKGDFAGLSVLSKSQIIGAVLSSEFRWLVNPAGSTKVEDFEKSENGAAIPGLKDDIVLVESSKSTDLQVTLNISAEYINRLGRGFLLGAQGVRDAERVTAEEIRLVANELETALGGAYSRIAVDLQRPLAFWLMELTGIGVAGQGFEPTVITGLEALSRTGDLEDLKLWVADLGALAALPPALLARIKFNDLALAFAAPRRVKVSAFLKSDEEVAQEQAAAREAEQQTTIETEGVKAGAQAEATVQAQESQA